MNIYVASSWRNPLQQDVVKALRDASHNVYDFRNPAPLLAVFHWSDIDEGWKSWTPSQFRDGLSDWRAREGFFFNMDALRDCDACVLVMPCGRSSHLELGWACGARKRTCILLSDGEPELMYRMVDHICVSLEEVVAVFDPEELDSELRIKLIEKLDAIVEAHVNAEFSAENSSIPGYCHVLLGHPERGCLWRELVHMETALGRLEMLQGKVSLKDIVLQLAWSSQGGRRWKEVVSR